MKCAAVGHFCECHSAAVDVAEDVVGLFLHGGGFAFLDVVLVPGGDFGYVGSGFFDDALAAEAAVELQAGCEVEAVEFEVFGFGDAFGALLEEDVAGGAGGDAAAGVVEEDVVVLGDVEEGHGQAVAFVGKGVEGELYGFVLGLEGDADHVWRGRLGEIDFRERVGVFGHIWFNSIPVGKLQTRGFAEYAVFRGGSLLDNFKAWGSRSRNFDSTGSA